MLVCHFGCHRRFRTAILSDEVCKCSFSWRMDISVLLKSANAAMRGTTELAGNVIRLLASRTRRIAQQMPDLRMVPVIAVSAGVT